MSLRQTNVATIAYFLCQGQIYKNIFTSMYIRPKRKRRDEVPSSGKISKQKPLLLFYQCRSRKKRQKIERRRIVTPL